MPTSASPFPLPLADERGVREVQPPTRGAARRAARRERSEALVYDAVVSLNALAVSRAGQGPLLSAPRRLAAKE